MPERETIRRARKDAEEGKSPSTQAGEFVREEIHHVREGKHGVKNPKQAIAIGLREAGASKYESDEKNRENLKRTKARERHGATEKDRTEHGSGREHTRAQLYEQAKRRNIPGRSKMNKHQLERALHQ